MEKQSVPALPLSHWEDSTNREYLSRLLVALAVAAHGATNDVPTASWRSDLTAAGALVGDVSECLSLLEGAVQDDAPTRLTHRAASALSSLRCRVLPPIELFRAHLTILEAVQGQDESILAGEGLAMMVGRWNEFAREQRAQIIDPNLNCPAIIEACADEARRGVAKVASVLLAVAPAVGAKLHGGAGEALRDLSNQVPPPPL